MAIGKFSMKHLDTFNFKGVSESRKVAWGPKNPTKAVIGMELSNCLNIRATKSCELLLLYDS